MVQHSTLLEAPTIDFGAFAAEIDAAQAADVTSDMPAGVREDLSLAWRLGNTGQLEAQWTAAEPAPAPKERATHTNLGSKTYEEFMGEYEQASLAEMAAADAAWMERQMTGQEAMYSFLGSIGSHAEAVTVVENSVVVNDTLDEMQMSTYRFTGTATERVDRDVQLMRKDVQFEAAQIAVAEGITMEEAWKKVDQVKLFGEYDLDDIFLDLEYDELIPKKPATPQPIVQVSAKPKRQPLKKTTIDYKELAKWGGDEMALRFNRFHQGSESPLSERVGEHAKTTLIAATVLGWLAAGYGAVTHLLEKQNDSEFTSAVDRLLNLFQ